MKTVGLKLLRLLSFLIFWGILFVVFQPYVLQYLPMTRFPRDVLAAIGAAIALGLIALALATLRLPIMPARRPRPLLVLLFLTLALFLPFSFLLDAFGSSSVESLLYTLDETPAGRIAAIGFGDFSPTLLKYVLFLIGVLVSGFALLKLSSRSGAAIAGASLVAVLLNPLSDYAFHRVVPSRYHRLITGADVAGPVITARPQRPLNLIIVYLESIERTYRDLEGSAAGFAAFSGFEDQGISFTNIGQVSGTGFTASGMVASQCGVPVLPDGIFNPRRKIHEDLDRMPDFTAFMTGVTCLGDILVADGYNASYLNGSVLSIFSKGDFFLSHGFQRVFGLESYPGWESEPRRNIWGMNDDLLFERVTDELRHLAARPEPFLLTTLTIATHGPDAYLDDGCIPPEGGGSAIGAAIRCSGGHVKDLLAEIDRLGIADETLVLLTSDHLAFRNTMWRQLESHREARRNYVVLLGAGAPRAVSRSGSMLDLFPTLLEAMGYGIAGGRANLGRSLLSDSPTLSEALGLEALSRAIAGNAALQKALWDGSGAATAR